MFVGGGGGWCLGGVCGVVWGVCGVCELRRCIRRWVSLVVGDSVALEAIACPSRPIQVMRKLLSVACGSIIVFAV